MCAVLGVSLLVLIVPGLFAVRMENYRPFITHGWSGFLAALPPCNVVSDLGAVADFFSVGAPGAA